MFNFRRLAQNSQCIVYFPNFVIFPAFYDLLFFQVYTGLFNCIGTILKVEGFRSLYRGFFATLIQIIPHGGAQFAIYNKISVIFKEKGKSL